MTRRATILICDDDPLIHGTLKHLLSEKYHLISAHDPLQAQESLKKQTVDLLILDVQMGPKTSGIANIPHFRSIQGTLPIAILSGICDFETVRQALRMGADDYIVKGASTEEIHHVVQRLLERDRLIIKKDQQNSELKQNQKQHVLIGRHPKIDTLREMAAKARKSSANVVIFGETGSGKEVLTRLLRKELPDGTLEPFVAVDSATILNSTAESILFGHEKGAFTGATTTKKGLFEEADGGIIYFDEIANMPLDIQARLLRVIQEKEICRLGSTRPIPLDFRVICATNKDLHSLVAEGKFLGDLLQRLEVIPISVPSLRERASDIPVILDYFLEQEVKTCQRRPELSSEALEVLLHYPWPGNVRELKNLVLYLTAMVEDDFISVDHLPEKFRSQIESTRGPKKKYYEHLRNFEIDLFKNHFQLSEGNISKMASALGLDRTNLSLKLREYGIHRAGNHPSP